MKILLLISTLTLTGCLKEENCYTTDIVERYVTETTEFYTITKPVYKVICE